MSDTRFRDLVLRAAALSENEQARARLERDEHKAWLRLVEHLCTREHLREVAARSGMTAADFDEYLVKFIVVLAEASVNTMTAIELANMMITLQRELEKKALMSAPEAEA